MVKKRLLQSKQEAFSASSKMGWEQTFTGLNKTMKRQFMIYKLVQMVTIIIGLKRQVMYHLVVNV